MTARTEDYHSSQIGARHAARIEEKPNYVFEKFTIFVVFLILILIAGGSWYSDSSSPSPYLLDSYSFLWYDSFIDISSFALIGFGFSLTYLRKYGFTALSMTVFLISLSIPLSLYSSEIITYFFIHSGDQNSGRISAYQLSHGIFGSITVLITFGVVAGRLNPTQLSLMCLLEIVFWTVNNYINEQVWKLHDTGFGISIHLFATYFGLAISFIIEPAIKDTDKKSMYHSDIFSLIGTTFMWLYWPSLNGYIASNEYYFRDRAIINTLLALCGSTMSSFLMSYTLMNNKNNHHKFHIQHIQQSTLSGAIAVATCVDLYLHPTGAICIGIIAGIISVIGYVYLSQIIERNLKIADTKGIHNVHGMPAILGGFIAAATLALSEGRNIYVDPTHEDYPFAYNSLYYQSAYTMVAMCTTFVMSIFCGSVSGWIIVMFRFPNYEFKDTDNFNVFYEYLSGDPFRDTIRGMHFGAKYKFKKNKKKQDRNRTDDMSSDSEDRLLIDGDFNWNDEYNDKGLGIQVVDSMISGMDTERDMDINDWRKCIEMNMMPHIKYISYANILSDYYFDMDDEDEQQNDENDEFYPLYCCAKIVKQSFENDHEQEEEKKEQEFEYYMTAKLKSIFKASDFKRKHLNLVNMQIIRQRPKEIEIKILIIFILSDYFYNLFYFSIIRF